MPRWSRRLLGWSPLTKASAGLGLAAAAVLGAYGVGISSGGATTAGIVSAIALAGIAGAGLLYAWRLGAGGPIE